MFLTKDVENQYSISAGWRLQVTDKLFYRPRHGEWFANSIIINKFYEVILPTKINSYKCYLFQVM